MAGIDDQRGGTEPRLNGADRELWRRSAGTVIAEDEAERFLDLAGFAEGRLESDEHERVAERLARDPDSVADVAAARSFAERSPADDAAPAQIIARACALVEEKPASTGWVIPFPSRYRPQPTLPGVARWAGLAAAMLVASWLGFDLGSSTSAAFGPIAQPSEDNLVRDMLEPSTGFVRDLTEGLRT